MVTTSKALVTRSDALVPSSLFNLLAADGCASAAPICKFVGAILLQRTSLVGNLVKPSLKRNDQEFGATGCERTDELGLVCDLVFGGG